MKTAAFVEIDGERAETLLWHRDLSRTERDELMAYLRDRFRPLPIAENEGKLVSIYIVTGAEAERIDRETSALVAFLRLGDPTSPASTDLNAPAASSPP